MRKKYILSICVLVISFLAKATPFVTVWDLSIPGSNPNSITFTINSTTAPVNYSWETIPSGVSGSGTLPWGWSIAVGNLPSNSVIRLSIDSSNLNQIFINNNSDAKRLLNIEQWGTIKWKRMTHSFLGCSNLNISASDIPDFSTVDNISLMFADCISLNSPANINNWDMSTIKDMSGMFYGATNFNQSINNWNVSNDTSLVAMFYKASSFNQPISNWNTSNVSNMRYMFYKAISFNQPISSWDVSNVIDFTNQFKNASSFNQSLENWKLNSALELFSFFDSSGVDCSNYTSTLKGWENNPNLPNNLWFGAASIHYGINAIPSRNFLISKGWIINGDIANDFDCYPTSVSTTEAPNDISEFYPNPTTSKLSFDIFSYGSDNINLSVYNALGQLMLRDKMNLQYGKNVYQLNTQNYNSGVYFVSIKIGDKQIVKQLVVSQ